MSRRSRAEALRSSSRLCRFKCCARVHKPATAARLRSAQQLTSVPVPKLLLPFLCGAMAALKNQQRLTAYFKPSLPPGAAVGNAQAGAAVVASFRAASPPPSPPPLPPARRLPSTTSPPPLPPSSGLHNARVPASVGSSNNALTAPTASSSNLVHHLANSDADCSTDNKVGSYFGAELVATVPLTVTALTSIVLCLIIAQVQAYVGVRSAYASVALLVAALYATVVLQMQLLLNLSFSGARSFLSAVYAATGLPTVPTPLPPFFEAGNPRDGPPAQLFTPPPPSSVTSPEVGLPTVPTPLPPFFEAGNPRDGPLTRSDASDSDSGETQGSNSNSSALEYIFKWTVDGDVCDTAGNPLLHMLSVRRSQT